MDNEMFPLTETYDVRNGEMFGTFSRLLSDDLADWREEGRYPELFAILDAGVTRIREEKESATDDSEWSAVEAQ